MSLVMGMRNKPANDTAFIRETQSALKTLSTHWISPTTKSKSVDNKSSDPFDDGNMPPISSATINYTNNYDTSATKIKSHKKYRPNEPKYPTHDFNDLVDDCSNGCDKTAAYATVKEQKCDVNVYEQMADYRMSTAMPLNVQSSSAFGHRSTTLNVAMHSLRQQQCHILHIISATPAVIRIIRMT